MGRHVEVQKMSERENYHTYWILHLPMLLSTIKKRVCTEKYKYQQYIAVGQIVKNACERVAHEA